MLGSISLIQAQIWEDNIISKNTLPSLEEKNNAFQSDGRRRNQINYNVFSMVFVPKYLCIGN